MNIELYIANKLCDLEKSDLSIRLKRQFINPTELSTKDAQKSYSITLPSTPANDAIFRHANVEEVKGKFTIYPDAKLYVNGILILDGKFRLSEISKQNYKGNLGVPAPLTVKDVFGEKKMNEAGEWLIPFVGEKSITEYNKRKDSPECIFPFVLYGLMNKTQMKDKETIDASTRFALQDFPPSVNCIQMLKKIFENTTKDGKPYSLSGTALNDKRLQNLYVSYRNPEDYPMPFTYGEVKISGKWSNLENLETNNINAEKQASINHHTYGERYRFVTCDILQSDNVNVITVDPSDLLIKEGKHVAYKAPITGLYRIKLNATIEMPPLHYSIDGSGCYILGKDGYYDKFNRRVNLGRDFRNVACEVKLVRYSDDKYELSNATMDNEFRQINRDPKKPAYYPEPGNVHFVDPKQKDDILCGFSWGTMSTWNRNRDKAWEDRAYNHVNPLLTQQTFHEDSHNPIAMKHGNSWDEGVDPFRSCATYNPGYNKDESHVPEKDDEQIEKYVLKVDMENSSTHTRMDGTHKGYGSIEQMIHLDEGEKITLLSVMDMSTEQDWIYHTVDFDISIEPFAQEKAEEENSWLQMHNDGYSVATMNWKDPASFLTDRIDLIKFLPSAVKVDEWVDNFCKAFNLELLHRGKLDFELNLRDKQLSAQASNLIDLDQKASVQTLTNQPFALPNAYQLGFTLNNAEEGHHKQQTATPHNDALLGGAGLYQTGNTGTEPTTQKSNFSYCWYKTLSDKRNSMDENPLSVPIISNKEVWQDRNDYSSMMSKRYYDLPQRFWYPRDQTHPFWVGNAATGQSVEAALVTNTFNNKLSLSLDYEDKPNSIARSYFMLLNNSNNYTTVQCYLSPNEYNKLHRVYVKYNGDLYNVAEADGYDPLGKTKTTLKLIRKI